MDKIFDNIIEAIKYADPTFPIDKLDIVVRNRKYEAMELEDGKIGAIPTGSLWQPNLFRGEKKEYPSIIPSIQRNLSELEVLIAKLKVKEFENTLMRIPNIRDDVENGVAVDFTALAQHYGFATNLIDLTSNILVAAFFATNNCDENYSVVENGIGVIRLFSSFNKFDTENMFKFDKHFHIEGVQPFRRPAFQDAMGYEIFKGEDVSDKFHTIRFRHSKEHNEQIRNKFCYKNKCVLFPDESAEYISNKIIKNYKISRQSIMDFAKENSMEYDSIVELIKDEIKIIDYPVVNVGRKLIEKYNLELEKNPYEITGRVMMEI